MCPGHLPGLSAGEHSTRHIHTMQELGAAAHGEGSGCAALCHRGEVQVGVFQVESSGFRALGEFSLVHSRRAQAHGFKSVNLVSESWFTDLMLCTSHRQRSWWSPFRRRSRLTCPRRKRRRSKQRWRQQEGLWFWSRRPSVTQRDLEQHLPVVLTLTEPGPGHLRVPDALAPRGGNALSTWFSATAACGLVGLPFSSGITTNSTFIKAKWEKLCRIVICQSSARFPRELHTLTRSRRWGRGAAPSPAPRSDAALCAR